MERTEVDKKYTWNLDDIFPSDEAWEKEFKAVEEEYGKFDFTVFQGKLHNKADLLKYFRLRDEGYRRIEKLYVYASMRHDEDLRTSKYTSYTAMMGSMIAKLSAAQAFVDPELTALSDEKLENFANDPDFAEYDYSLRRIRDSKAHVLSEGEEKLLALAGDVMGGFNTVFSMLDNADLNLPKCELDGKETQMSHGL